jgi:hypothetical protein
MIGDVISGTRLLFDAIRAKKDKTHDYRRMLLTDFVDPIYAQLETAHKEYLASFQNYRGLVETTDRPLDLAHPVFAQMQKDHALSDMDRAKLVAMSQHLDNFRSTVGKEMAKDPAGRFAQHVIDYVTSPAHELTERWGYNAPRTSMLMNLEKTFRADRPDAEKRLAAIALLDEGVDRLQKQYVAITREYMELKANLLA